MLYVSYFIMSLKFHVYFTLDSTSSFILPTLQEPTSHVQPYWIVQATILDSADPRTSGKDKSWLILTKPLFLSRFCS